MTCLAFCATMPGSVPHIKIVMQSSFRGHLTVTCTSTAVSKSSQGQQSRLQSANLECTFQVYRTSTLGIYCLCIITCDLQGQLGQKRSAVQRSSTADSFRSAQLDSTHLLRHHFGFPLWEINKLGMSSHMVCFTGPMTLV